MGISPAILIYLTINYPSAMFHFETFMENEVPNVASFNGDVEIF